MLTQGEAIRFSAADFGKEVFWEAFDLFALYFMIHSLALPPRLAGTILMAALLVDAVSDPIAGAFFDRREKSRHSTLPFFMLFPALCSILLVAFYGMPGALSGQLGLAVTFALIYRISYTLVDVPINAITAYLVRTEQEKSLLWGLRKGAAAIAALLISALGTSLRNALNSADTPALFVAAIATLSALACGTYAISWSAIPKAWRIPRSECKHAAIGLVKILSRSGRFWGIASLLLLNAGILSMVSRSAIFFADAPGTSMPSYSLLLTALVSGRTLAIPIVSFISIRVGRRRSLSLILGLFWLSSFGLCWTGSAFSAAGLSAADASSAIPILLVLLAANGFSGSGLALVIWSYSPDMLEDTSIAKNDLVATSLAFFSMTVKIGTGLGTALLAALVSFQPPDATSGLLAISALVTLFGTGIATALSLMLPPFCGTSKAGGKL